MLVDLIIVLVVGLSIHRNWGGGFLRPFWASLGFFGGLVLGRLLETFTLKLFHTPDGRAIVTVVSIFGPALLGLSLGELVGLKLKIRSNNHPKLNIVDNVLGSLLTAASILLSVWLGAAILSTLPASGLKDQVNKSHIIKWLDDILPSAPHLISDLGQLVDPNGFPDVFIGSEPIPKGNVNLPSLGSLEGVVNADKNSVVRIQGLGCGGIVSGSGFVVSDDLVATNAHVVAGIANPIVEDTNGRHKVQVVDFDPKLDFAVLKVQGLAGKPLTINTGSIKSKTPGAVLGYPGGGNFMAGSAAVLEQFNASGHDIYGNGVTLRSVYEIQANVIPGNSGGPLINAEGQVIGVVFAESTSYQHVGYALATPKVSSEIHQAEESGVTVSTGQKCVD
jgi:S1-C subfamily serine protease